MGEFPDRVQAKMDVVLEQVCAELTNGGDHESRRYVAEQERSSGNISMPQGGGSPIHIS